MSDQTNQQENSLENPSEEVRSDADQPETTTTNAQASSTDASDRDAVGELVEEVRELGNQLEAAFRAALESERTKQLQRDLMGGLKELSSQVKTALKSAQDNPRVQQASERGREVLRNAQQSKAAQDLQETLVTGVAQLNVQLRKLVERLETIEQNASTTTSTQHVPVEHEDSTPTTGPTTRLDESGTSNETTRLEPHD